MSPIIRYGLWDQKYGLNPVKCIYPRVNPVEPIDRQILDSSANPSTVILAVSGLQIWPHASAEPFGALNKKNSRLIPCPYTSSLPYHTIPLARSKTLEINEHSSSIGRLNVIMLGRNESSSLSCPNSWQNAGEIISWRKNIEHSLRC